jgi:long-subunit fatty acid transport protein
MGRRDVACSRAPARPRLRSALVAASLGLALALSPAAAHANPLGTYGFGSRETSMGGAVTADAQGFSATFYNPAGLARGDRLDLSVGYFRVDQRLSINGGDNNVDPVRGVVAGLVAPGNFLGLPFAFGVATHLPDDRLSRVRTLKQEIPRWELYDNRAQILFIAAELAIRPFPWLSIGGGIAFLSSTRGDFGITGTANLKEPYDSQLRHEVDADLTTVRIPMMGVRLDPTERVSVGVSYRGESKLDLQLAADIKGNVDPGTIKVLVPVGYSLTAASLDAFHPRQVALGTSVKVSARLKVNVDFVWTQWSSYQSATSRTTAHLQLDSFKDALAVPPDPKPTVVRDPEFRDRVAPHLGVEVLAVQAPSIEVPVRLGYVFELSPVPPQSGPTNFVDADRHTFAVGAGVRLPAPLAVLPGEVRLDVHAAYYLLPERTTLKANPADFVGDFTSKGHQTNVGATLGVGF